MIEQIRELTNLPGVSGLEDQVRNYIYNLIKNLGEVTIDNLGNLILKVSEGNKKILITAHMDDVGLLATGW